MTGFGLTVILTGRWFPLKKKKQMDI